MSNIIAAYPLRKVDECVEGSPVLWKDQEGHVIVEGQVTALAPNRLLRFTVFDVRREKPPVTAEDGISHELSEQNSQTTLRLLQGDFSAMAEGEKYQRLSAEAWNRVLPKVKALAEHSGVSANESQSKEAAISHMAL